MKIVIECLDFSEWPGHLKESAGSLTIENMRAGVESACNAFCAIVSSSGIEIPFDVVNSLAIQDGNDDMGLGCSALALEGQLFKKSSD